MDSEPVVTSVVLADSVIVEHGTGKLSLIGCFNTLGLPTLPSMFPGFFAVIGITNIGSNGARLALTVRVEVEATGHVLASAGGQVDIGVQTTGPTPAEAPAPAAEFTDMRKVAFDIPIRFGPLIFPQAGPFSIVVLINNEFATKRNLLVLQNAPTPHA